MDRRTCTAENRRQRQRLEALAARLGEEELGRSLGEDWTVAVALAHLAFWDRRCLLILRRWQAQGVAPCPIDIDITNEALLPTWRALPPRSAAELAVAAAREVDREVESFPERLMAEVEAIGEGHRLDRARHRQLHLDPIEALQEGA